MNRGIIKDRDTKKEVGGYNMLMTTRTTKTTMTVTWMIWMMYWVSETRPGTF
jgi:hypothetical protein